MTERERRLFDLAKESVGENIVWGDDPSTLLSATGATLSMDAVGKDSEDRTIIVEVKAKSCAKNPNDRRTANRDAEHKVVGQILDYATAYMEQHKLTVENLRLIIVGDWDLKTVDNICRFLRKQGIYIEHISVGALL